MSKDIAIEDLPADVQAAARRLMEAFIKSGGKVATPDGLMDAGELEIVSIGTFHADNIGTADGHSDDAERAEVDEFLDMLAEEDEAEAQALIARGITRQPKLPRIFRLIIDNYNMRVEIRSKGSDMTQYEWRELKELYRDMRDSLRPAAERALSREPS